MLLPKCLPDELLLSRMIRYITISGDDVTELLRMIFGSDRSSIHPFLTSGLKQIAKASGETAGDLLIQQTLAPLFFFFVPLHADQLKRFLLVNQAARAVRESQLPSFGAGNSLCLKWCSLCAQQDLLRYGVTYWHRSHQIPGVTACFFHHYLLNRYELTQRQRVLVSLLPGHNDYLRPALESEVKVANVGFELLQFISRQQASQIDIAMVYRTRLAELGYITYSGRVRRKSLMREFVADVGQYRTGLDTPFFRHPKDYRYITQLLEQRSSHHPFRHLLFTSWLFNSAQELFEINISQKITPQINRSVVFNTRNNCEQNCLVLLQQKHSLSEVYRVTGKSRCYLKRLAHINRILLQLKPKVLTPILTQRIIQLAYAGIHRKVISERCGIGIGSVEQVISSQPDLVEYRKKCRWESKRRRYRADIARYRKLHPMAIRQEIKSRCNAAFFWLYGQDKNWLENNLPKALMAPGRYKIKSGH
ncbi:TnsD family Tn7-like transposition protein [Yersinia hibernica]|uniref:Transposon Tn7 transposition protein TnsD C-termianl domain-containing protein n=1 Tax=Yersinia hibernica TaxID=2339259 RepID=A0ABX5R6E1_9GAMM|nr:TnsD family Tn7-like transposition protein [Yersinia hibernica]QAX80856.1 hypothetical protein D5F51_21420 [Yersinia hibernica]CNL12851.1 Uncharacterised protein [Yersinia intermedia]